MHELVALIPYFRPYIRLMALGWVLIVIGNMFNLLAPKYLGRGIDALADGQPLSAILTAAGLMVGVTAIGGLARYGMREILNGASRRVEFDLRNDLYQHLGELSADFYQRTPTGHLITLATSDIQNVRMAAGPAIMYFVDTITRTVIAVPFMVAIDGRLTLLAFVPMIALPAAMFYLGRTVHRRSTAVQDQFSAMSTHAHEHLTGIRVVRAYRMERREEDRWRAFNREYLRRSIALARAQGMFRPFLMLLGGLGNVIVVWYGGLLVLRGTVTVGAFLAFAAYLTVLIWPMIALGWVTNLFQRAAASMRRLNRVFETVPSIGNAPAPKPLPPTTRGRSITFDHVWFEYPAHRDGERGWALRDVSFELEAGATLAIVGATGAGKSTLVDLIPRIFDPQRGAVRIDGVDVRDLDLAELRSAIGFVPQETFLFSDTIARNILPDDDDLERMEHAARIAELHRAVDEFPARYDTMLGERGVNLSGGQKQRTAIARALARDPSVVILDDALSAVDSQTEIRILRGLRDALQHRTAIIVSHRAAAVRDADRIIVLGNGAIVEVGIHRDLVAAGGPYWELIRRQEIAESLER